MLVIRMVHVIVRKMGRKIHIQIIPFWIPKFLKIFRPTFQI